PLYSAGRWCVWFSMHQMRPFASTVRPVGVTMSGSAATSSSVSRGSLTVGGAAGRVTGEKRISAAINDLRMGHLAGWVWPSVSELTCRTIRRCVTTGNIRRATRLPTSRGQLRACSRYKYYTSDHYLCQTGLGTGINWPCNGTDIQA